MANILEIIARANSLKNETALNSISPERAGGIMYDTLIYINQMQLQEANPLLISKIYATVSAMEADSAPVSDITGQALKEGQVVCIVTSSTSSADYGVIYRYNGTSDGVSSWTACGKLGSLPYLEGYQFIGVATPSTDPGVPTQKVAYLAVTAGTYEDFGNLTVSDGEAALLKWNGSAWIKETTGLATEDKLTQLGQKVCNNYFVGNANTYVKQRIDGLIPGHIYRIYFREPNWDKTGVTISASNYLMALCSYDSSNVLTNLGSCRTNETPDAYYDITLPSNSAYFSVEGRAALGTKVWFYIFDITDWMDDIYLSATARIIDSLRVGFVQGTLTDAGGVGASTTRVRNVGAIPTPKCVAAPAGYLVHEICFYSSWTSDSSFMLSSKLVVGKPFCKIKSSAPYMRFSIRKPDGGTITAEEVISAYKLIYTQIVALSEIDSKIEDIIYTGSDITFDGDTGYLSLGATLSAGKKYQIEYNCTAYNGKLYYIELTSDAGAGVTVASIVSGLGGVSTAKGATLIALTKDVKGVRIGTGTPVPADANTHLTIREVPWYALKSEFDAVEEQLIVGDPILAPFFDTEMQATIDSVTALTAQRCFVMPIVTDTHWRWTTTEGNDVKRRSINNVRYFNRRVYCDAVAHLGDMLDTGVIGSTPDAELYDLIQQYLLQLATSNKNFYAANGNHDGAGGNTFNEMVWYGLIGRATANDPFVIRYEETPYFYIDHKPTKLRCVFLANPDNVTGGGTYWGFSPRELDWLENDAFDVPDGYSIIILTHIAPVSGYADSAANLSDFADLCTAFNSGHTGKILAVICGHSHFDLTIPVGWTYTGGYSNPLPCPIVILGANYYNLGSSTIITTWGGTRYGRVVGTDTEDLWTILMYTPDDANYKLHFVRFGAGVDFDLLPVTP